jgi:hypothetical protein
MLRLNEESYLFIGCHLKKKERKQQKETRYRFADIGVPTSLSLGGSP